MARILKRKKYCLVFKVSFTEGFKCSWLCHENANCSIFSNCFICSSCSNCSSSSNCSSCSSSSNSCNCSKCYCWCNCSSSSKCSSCPEPVSMLQLHEQRPVSISQNNIDTYFPRTTGFVFTRQNSCTTSCHHFISALIAQIDIINRPGVAGTVLQTPLLLG